MGDRTRPGAVIGALADDTSAWIVPHTRVFGEGAEHNARGAHGPLPHVPLITVP